MYSIYCLYCIYAVYWGGCIRVYVYTVHPYIGLGAAWRHSSALSNRKMAGGAELDAGPKLQLILAHKYESKEAFEVLTQMKRIGTASY